MKYLLVDKIVFSSETTKEYKIDPNSEGYHDIKHKIRKTSLNLSQFLVPMVPDELLTIYYFQLEKGAN